MCGIFGYKGERKDAPQLVVGGLKKLEYRGYDSWGVAMLKNKALNTVKKVGKIGESGSISIGSSNVAIGHTRWSTHGGVTEQNAHPHLSSDGKTAVVHNGIIENYYELKQELSSVVFKSETDTEVIPHLIEGFLNKGESFEGAVRKAIDKLDGTFALAVLNADSEKVIVARRGSPLVIGVGDKAYFIASDIPAFIDKTKNVMFLDDNEMAVLDKDIKVLNFNEDKTVDKKVVAIGWDAETAEKGGYKHFMLKEIHEQPKAVEQTLQGRLDGKDVVLEELEKIDIDEIQRIVIVACGTSWHAGLVGEFMIEELAKIPVEVEYASEFRYRDPLVGEGTLVIAISQSGETADTLAAMEEAKKKGAKILSICNVMGSTVSRQSDAVIYTRAGPEIGVASTKAFTTQLTALFLITAYLARKKKSLTREQLDDMVDTINEIPLKMREILKDEAGVQECAKRYYNKLNALYLGRGVNFPIALEGALKLKEVSYLHAEGYPAAEMKHGPIALIDKNMPTVVIATKDNKTYKKVIGNIEEVKARGGEVIAIATEGDEGIKQKADYVVYIPETRYTLSALLAVVPLQLLAYHVAELRECDIDKPRNLAKSVTVE